MKRYLILLLLIANLGLGVQSFAVMTKDERIKLENQIDEAYEKEDEKKLFSLIIKYVKEFPNNAEYLNKLGVLYDNEENYSEAEKWYLKAIEKGNYIAISNLAYIYFEKGEYEKAIKYYKEYQKIADDTNNYFWIGSSYDNLEDYKNAKEWYLKATKYDKDGFSENLLGIIYAKEGNQKEALKWYSAAIKKGNLWAYDSLAALYISMGDYKTADKWVRKGLELAKNKDDKELLEELQETFDFIQKGK